MVTGVCGSRSYHEPLLSQQNQDVWSRPINLMTQALLAMVHEDGTPSCLYVHGDHRDHADHMPAMYHLLKHRENPAARGTS